MAFTIISPTRVEVDGVDAGLLYDFIIANPGKASEIKSALVAWHASHVVAEQARCADVAKAKADAAAMIQLKEAEFIAAAEAMQADLDALGTKEEAQAIRREQKRAELLRALAELEDLPGNSG